MVFDVIGTDAVDKNDTDATEAEDPTALPLLPETTR